MNILYISNLTGNLYAGPNHSVPAQIRAQSTYDNVFWYNINAIKREEWSKDGLNCKNLNDYPNCKLADLPKPFNNPDIVVVEEFYCFPFSKIICDVIKAKIPYVIIPRSELTCQAQKKKSLKKKMGNFLFFKKFAKKARTIQYLTEQEYLDSGNEWNKNHIIIPNGMNAQSTIKNSFSENGIKAIYIGRYELYQKGLDLLLSAIINIKEQLRECGFSLAMYGVDQDGTVDALNKIIMDNEIDDLIHIHESVFGEAKKEILLSADVFIMTSRFEGMPMGMIEALSLGIPCIASKGTNMADEISRFEAGWTTEEGVESIANALLEMSFAVDKFKTVSRNALRLSQNYTWDSIARITHEKYAALRR